MVAPFDFQHWRWLHALMTMVALFGAGNFWHTHTADPLQTNMLIGCMAVVKCDICKISGAYAHLDCIASTVSDIGNRHSMQVTHSYKERTFHVFPPQLKINSWTPQTQTAAECKIYLISRNGNQGRAVCQIWGHSFHNARNPPILPVSPIQNWTRVTRWTTAAQITGSLFGTTLHGTPQFYPFHQFKIGLEWHVERRLPRSLDHYSAPHYSDVIMRAMASQITGVLIVYSTVCSGADQRKHQSSTSLVCVRGGHRWSVNSLLSPVNSPNKSQWRGTCFHLMMSSWKQEI